MIPLWIDIPLI